MINLLLFSRITIIETKKLTIYTTSWFECHKCWKYLKILESKVIFTFHQIVLYLHFYIYNFKRIVQHDFDENMQRIALYIIPRHSFI